MIKAFPKIFSIGQDYISQIFDSEVEITEKVDGSQFNFGKIEDELHMRSKGKQIFPEAPEKMFKEAVDYVYSIAERIPNNTVYYCEYLKSPHHNILKYDWIPKNHLVVFGVSDPVCNFKAKYSELINYAEDVGLTTVPLLYSGLVSDVQFLKALLETKSFLGGSLIEGVVVKNYSIPFLLGGQPIPIMAGKYVSEKFKETNQESWSKENTTRGKWEVFLESFRTEARWNKAIQHLREAGTLENAPRDIGGLIRAIHQDIEDEEKESIKGFLWSHFKQDLMRKSIAGFPEWYKGKLMENVFQEDTK